MPKRKALHHATGNAPKERAAASNAATAPVVDLTNSDEENDSTRPSKARRTTGKASAAESQLQKAEPAQRSYQADERVDEDDANEVIQTSQDGHARAAHPEHYGTLHTSVVGIRYYRGCATKGEMVLPRRDPGNEHDSNAIRILNVQGEQIGHFPRQVAKQLARYMDEYAVSLEAKLTGRPGGYDIPVEVHIFGTDEPRARAALKDRLRNSNLPTNALDQRDQHQKKQMAKELSKVAKQGAAAGLNSTGQQWECGLQPGQWAGSSSQSSGLSSQEGMLGAMDIMAYSERYNPRDVGQVVEKYGVNEEALENLPLATQPVRMQTQLLPYQQQGLAWLIAKENPQLPGKGSEDIVQLWKRSGAKKFTNIATNFSLEGKDPVLASGGILADDMGLGKTLQVISLIVNGLESAPKKASAGKCNATLIISPLGVMSNWSNQIQQHVSQKAPLRVFTYHGTGRAGMTSKDFDQYDVVITTYGTLATEFLPKGEKKPTAATVVHKTGLYSTQWRRVVLDEGHTIRNPNAKSALAACHLRAQSKWALTGTPIINTLKDLYSLVKFIGLTGGLQEFEIFNRILIRGGRDDCADATLLLQALMATICLRRRKDMKFIDLKLPELTEYIHRVKFSPSEAEKYDALSQEAKGVLRTYQASQRGGDGKKAQAEYRHLLEVLLRLRQVCNHWKLCEERVMALMEVLASEKSVKLTPENVKALQDILALSIESRDECPVCMEDLVGHNPVITNCGHVFGRDCIVRVIDGQHKCPMCREVLEDEQVLVEPAAELGEGYAPIKSDADDDNGETSSKVKALMSVLQATHKEKGSKVIVFSQWCRFLDLVEPHIASAGYKYARLDGSMSATARDSALDAIATDDKTTILLASLGVCSVGLNLTAANTVVLCDTWWAPAIEDQAVDRVHRLGQKKPCTVWRLVVDGSIEERTLEVQADKRKLMSTAFQEKEGARKNKAGRLGDIQRLLA